MKEVYYADSGWVDINDHAFEDEDECIAFAKEMIIRRLGKEKVDDFLSENMLWLDQQFDVYTMDFHPKNDN